MMLAELASEPVVDCIHIKIGARLVQGKFHFTCLSMSQDRYSHADD